MTNGDYLAQVVKDIRLYFKHFEEQWYDLNNIPQVRRSFTKYHMNDISRFYVMRNKNILKDLELLIHDHDREES